MKGIKLSHLATPYHLGQDLTDFGNELLYVGITYYDGHLVFEHIIKPITEVIGIQVTNIELYFSNNKLVAISFFLKEKCDNTNKVVKLIESHFDQKAGLIVDEVLCRDVGRHIYTWEMEFYKLGLLTYWDTDQLFIQYSFKEFELFW